MASTHRAAARRRAAGASGRFVLRVPAAVHEALRTAARARGVSLNDYCTRVLAAAAAGEWAPSEAATPAVRRARELFGTHLVGLVVFGSWARGHAADTSDVDLLVVLDAAVPLTRALYRRWDASAVAWDGRPVEPHFVHMTDATAVVGGVWPEAALDGIVVFERAFTISRHLGRVRAEIVSGRLIRRVAHGQPYWTEVA